MNLYIFATGGTGSRVVKALIYLLASGAKIENVNTIIPIIIDPHINNHDLIKTVNLIELYKRIRSSLKQEPEEGDFFYTKILSLKEKSNRKELTDKFTFQMVSDDEKSDRFQDYIDFSAMDAIDQKMVNLLFSESNLKTKMDIGFVGNPNIGSVVLNQISDSDEFNAFASSFEKNDRVFIISSIFGGTGASAFPIILKNIRGCEIGEKGFVKECSIGALTVMPYFKVSSPNNDNTLIDENSFKAKTKAALHYYLEGVQPVVDKLYGIADVTDSVFEYDPGEKQQKNNKAHFIEMIGATAIFDFMGNDNFKKGEYSEYGLNPNVAKSKELYFENLPNETQNILQKPLTKFTLMLRHIHYIDGQRNHNPAWTRGENPIDNNFKSKTFYKLLQTFLDEYKVWLSEMSDEVHSRSFRPFQIDTITPLSKTINNVPLKEGKTIDYDSIDEYLSGEMDNEKSYSSPEDKLLRVFSTGLEKMLQEKY